MFKFPLQRLLELKARREQEMARQLAVARGAATREADARDALRALQDASAASLAERTTLTPSVGELVSLAYTVTQLSEHVDEASARTEAAEAAAALQTDALQDAVRERQVLDRLRDRRLDEHRTTEQQQERATMDAVALGQFTARRTTPHDTPPEGRP